MLQAANLVGRALRVRNHSVRAARPKLQVRMAVDFLASIH